VYFIEKIKRILKLFSPFARSTVLVCFHYGNTRTGPHKGASNVDEYENNRIFREVSIYSGNYTRWGHSYYGTPIRIRVRSIERCHF